MSIFEKWVVNASGVSGGLVCFSSVVSAIFDI